jgi:microsomal dipeptidase-like Zn-dependent dipeptidase
MVPFRETTNNCCAYETIKHARSLNYIKVHRMKKYYSPIIAICLAMTISCTRCVTRRPIHLSEVPLTGSVVTGSAMIHEHLMAEHAFSGKWHWGSVDGLESDVMRVCDGDGNTHAGADLVCSVGSWITMNGDKLGFDTCCHSGGLSDCTYKATNGYDPDEWWSRLDWPKWDTQAHPRYWVGDMQRALTNGLKLIFAIAVENESLCAKVDTHVTNPQFRPGYHCDHGDSYNSVTRQIREIKQFADKYSSTFQIAYAPDEARTIINSGKMAIVLGIEADYTWGNERDRIDYLARLDDYYNQGVRHIYLTHKLNGPLAGAAYPAESQVKVLQALHNCWYMNIGCNTGQAYSIDSSTNARDNTIMPSCPQRYVTNFYELCDDLAIYLLTNLEPDGFSAFPGTVTVPETNYRGESYLITKNRMGLTAAGKSVVQAMMRKGMFIDISHLSEKSIDDLYELSQCNSNYPLSATHALARAVLPASATAIDGRTPTSATAEFALSDQSLARIAATEGILGHFIAPDPTVDYAPSGVANDCQRSDKSLAQSLAYTFDKLETYRAQSGGERVNVALAGDFMGQGVGVAPRLGYSYPIADWCGGDSGQQQNNMVGGHALDPHLNNYSTTDDKERAQFATRGFAHPGLIRQLFDDLNIIGFPDSYQHAYQSEAAESVIRTWEKAVYISHQLP